MLMNAVPALFTAFFYQHHMMKIYSIGAGYSRVWPAIRKAVNFSMGLPFSGFLSDLAAAALLIIAAWEICILFRKKSDLAVFYLATLFAAPAFILFLSREQAHFLRPRHFFVLVPFLLILMSSSLCRLFKTGVPGKAAYALALSLFLTGNFVFYVPLCRYGRGQYFNAIQDMASKTRGPQISVMSDHDFRNSMILYYYERYLPKGKKLVYHNKIWSCEHTEWVIISSLGGQAAPLREIRSPAGEPYVLTGIYKHAGLSGSSWHLYRKAALSEQPSVRTRDAGDYDRPYFL
jgi:hypothetical protein